VLGQQAQFNEQQAQFSQRMLEIEQMQRRNTEDITKLVGVAMNLTLHSQDQDQRISALIQHGAQTDRHLEELATSLNALISVVERNLADGHKH
jgi:hypothetical protein